MRRILEIHEHQSTELPRDALTESVGLFLHERHARHVRVEFPTPASRHRWSLRGTSYVGFLPIDASLAIALRPKVPVHNLFAMLDVARNVRLLERLPGTYECESIEALYEIIAGMLARQVRARLHRGLLRRYVADEADLAYVRGRLDVRQMSATPWRAELPCAFEEHTADVVDNRLLLRALDVAARSGICGEATLPLVRQAWRELSRVATLEPLRGADCERRSYDRLSQDYEPLHALCWFLLEHAAPQHLAGERAMIPFLVEMNRLFESFVAAVLRRGLDPSLSVEAQWPLPIEATTAIEMVPDLIVRSCGEGVGPGRARCVIDAKYKDQARPSTDDVQQVVAYATTLGVKEAVLVYPIAGANGWVGQFGDVRVRTLALALDGDLGAAAIAFVRAVETVVRPRELPVEPLSSGTLL